MNSQAFQKRIKTVALVAALFSVCVFGYFVAKTCPWTHVFSSQHSLSATTKDILKQFHPTLQLDLFTQDIEQFHQVKILIEQYIAQQPNIKFHWKNKNYSFSNQYVAPALMATFNDTSQIIQLDQNVLNEAILTQSLFKLLRKDHQWLAFLSGHDEPSIYGSEAKDYKMFRIALENQGNKIQTVDLTKQPIIADNIHTLILSPKTSLLPIEQNLIEQFIARGGNLLWLIESKAARQPFLEELLQVQPYPGVIVDMHGQSLGTPHPAITIIEKYPRLPFLAPNVLSAFPWAVALQYNKKSPWEIKPLLETHTQTWTEFGPLQGHIQFNPEKNEKMGPLTLALQCVRAHPHHHDFQQRIVVIGNSRFISNGIIENYGNLAFAMNLISWLNNDDHLLQITQPTVQDTMIQIHLLNAILIQYGLLMIPMGFLCACFTISYLRNRKNCQVPERELAKKASLF